MTHCLWLLAYAGTAFFVLLAFGLLKTACDRAADEVDGWDDPATSIWHDDDTHRTA